MDADGGTIAADAAQDIDAGPKGDRWFQESGKIIALRENSDLYLDEVRAAEIDELITRAKALEIDAPGIVFMNIFARPPAIMDRIYLQSTDSTMQAEWQRGDIETGNENLDALITSLQPTKIEAAPFDLVELWFARWVNIETLVNRLQEFPFLYASEVCECMDGDDIELEDGETEALLTFYVRWDDCFSGCLNAHWWQVVVPHDPAQPAEVVDEGGDPLPPP